MSELAEGIVAGVYVGVDARDMVAQTHVNFDGLTARQVGAICRMMNDGTKRFRKCAAEAMSNGGDLDEFLAGYRSAGQEPCSKDEYSHFQLREVPDGNVDDPGKAGGPAGP